MKKILLFGFEDLPGKMTATHLDGNLKEMGIEVQCVEKEDYLKPLGVVAGAIPAAGPFAGKNEKYEGKPLPVRMLLFVGITGEDLDPVLELCRSCGVGREDLKAVLTPHNVAWTAVELCQELVMEHMQLNK